MGSYGSLKRAKEGAFLGIGIAGFDHLYFLVDFGRCCVDVWVHS